MVEIEIIADSPKETINQIKNVLGGSIQENWGEFTLRIENENATGNIRYIPFDWGVNLLDFDITFHKEIIFKIKAHRKFNPIRFIYPSLGSLKHRFGVHIKEIPVNQFQTLIFTNKNGGHNYIHYRKNEPLEINVIQIVRKEFLAKSTTNVASLNNKLYEVFVDTDHQHRFAHYGTLNLKMADLIKGLKAVRGNGMLRILKIEARVYEMLSLHIQQHNSFLKDFLLQTSLMKSELKTIRKFGNKILKKPAKDYTLNQLSIDSGLTQAKLQDGFKFIYKRTVTEYIRHIRLEFARDQLKNTDLNISQVVYSIGFSSRSYFSKIFKEKYGYTPNQFKKKIAAKT
ncbi:AraC family transcriptional regulator [Polaribacter litorisediminis]|uniref:helix-turn-helix domain-containing protein n=1 Tax=Polaribacter litorisediminis TaxID=1908341 RepID=UPI001CBB9D19|nr:AraC family transcriptional regulator [Polaribacter litorisediminis]UAM97115.1 AraC family transcriptional regulator [Polaribacter litorisediminis]